MLAPALDTLRLTLHVLAASIWVGGQIALADLVGPSRAFGPEAPRVLARAFARLAWPAFAVLVLTGFWNVSTVHWSQQSDAWKTVLIVKIVVVAAAGLGAFLHGRATSRTAIAVWGSVGGLASVAALVLGVLLAG
jgi:putative copper export protein